MISNPFIYKLINLLIDSTAGHFQCADVYDNIRCRLFILDLSDVSYQITTDMLIPQTRHMNSRSFFLNLIQKQKTKTRILLKALQKILIYFDFHPWDKVHFFSVLFRFVFLNFGERYLHNVWILQKICCL